MPTFIAEIDGITDSDAYFYIDFSASHTLAWMIDCETTAIGDYPSGSCADQPTLVEREFDSYSLPNVTGAFGQAHFGGYTVSGNLYTSQLCFGDVNCKFIKLYGVN